MKMLDPSQMLEATRLTRAGQLTEAMTLLQSMLGGAAPRGDDAQPATMPMEALLPPPLIDGCSERADVPFNAPSPRIAGSLQIELPGGKLARARRAPRPAD